MPYVLLHCITVRGFFDYHLIDRVCAGLGQNVHRVWEGAGMASAREPNQRCCMSFRKDGEPIPATLGGSLDFGEQSHAVYGRRLSPQVLPWPAQDVRGESELADTTINATVSAQKPAATAPTPAPGHR